MGLVGAFGCGDEEHQVRGAVLGAEVHGRGQPGHGQGGFEHRGGAAVRDRDAAGHAGGGLGLAGLGIGGKRVGVGGAALSGYQRSQVLDDLGGAGAQVGVEADKTAINEFDHDIVLGIRVSSLTLTASGASWVGVGIAEPGRDAAAEP